MPLFSKRSINSSLAWVTPPVSILPDAPIMSDKLSNEASPEYVQQLLLRCGIAATVIRAQMSIATMTYHCRLANITQLPKAKKCVEMISADLRKQVSFSAETVENAHFALSIARTQRETLYFRSALLTRPFADLRSHTACILGVDTSNKVIAVDISSLPHMVISGATGSGKSVLLNTIICSMLFKATPSSVEFVMIDCKQTELTQYEGLPHLALPVITDAQQAIRTLDNLCNHMDERYSRMRYNGTTFKKLIVIIDELSDTILLSKRAVEDSLVRLAQKGRACGIHLLLATQSPRASVLTGNIRANVPCKVALKCATSIDSRISIGRNGAENLLGKGDALIDLPSNAGNLKRFQAAYISSSDVSAIVNYWRSPHAKIAIA